jgi:hypothetical protein
MDPLATPSYEQPAGQDDERLLLAGVDVQRSAGCALDRLDVGPQKLRPSRSHRG